MDKQIHGYGAQSHYLWDIAKLPYNWKWTDGLEYPLTLIKTNGKRLTFETYEQHHEFIKNTFNK